MANYNSVHSGQEIDAAVSAVQEKEDNWDGKAEQADLSAHIADKDNPHEVDPEQIGAIPTTQKGAAGGVAELDDGGAVPTEQMPGYAVTSGVCAMGQACPGGPLKLDDIQGNTVLGGTPAYNAPVSMESVEGPLKLHVAGKNLIDLTRAEDQVMHGVTCTLDPTSGAMTLSGTCNRPGSSAFFMPNDDYPFWLPAGTYFLSGLQSDYESTSLRLYLNCYKDSDREQGIGIYGTTTTAGTAFTLPSGAWIVLALRVPDGMVADGIVVYPQIEAGTVKTAFEPYQGEFVEIPLLGTDGQALEPLRMSYIGRYGTEALPVPDRVIRKDGAWCVERNAAVADLTAATWRASANYLTPNLNGDLIRGKDSHWVISTHFPPSGANPSTVWTDGIWMGGGMAINKASLPNGTATTPEEMAAWCAAQAEAGTPVLVCYSRTEPVYEELHQDVQVLLNTLSVPGSVCSVWFEGDILPSNADIGLPRGDYPSAGLEGAYRMIAAHIADDGNPHGVDAEQTGAIPAAEKGAAGGVAELDSAGKVPSDQLPEMNYDPAGSAAAVQQALSAHTGNTSNPHETTAAQVGAATRAEGTISLPSTGWTDDTANSGYWYRSVTVSGMLSTDEPHVGLVKSFADADADDAMQEAWDLIKGAESLSGSLRFYAMEVPEVAVSLQWEVIR